MNEEAILAAFKEIIERTTKDNQDWNRDRDIMIPILKRIEKLEPQVSYSYGYLNLYVTGDAHTLAAVVRALRLAGFITNADKPEKDSTGWSAFYHKEHCESAVSLSFTSKVCRRIKIGTKLVEQDIFEIQCGELVLEPSAAEQQSMSVRPDNDIPF